MRLTPQPSSYYTPLGFSVSLFGKQQQKTVEISKNLSDVDINEVPRLFLEYREAERGERGTTRSTDSSWNHSRDCSQSWCCCCNIGIN